MLRKRSSSRPVSTTSSSSTSNNNNSKQSIPSPDHKNNTSFSSALTHFGKSPKPTNAVNPFLLINSPRILTGLMSSPKEATTTTSTDPSYPTTMASPSSVLETKLFAASPIASTATTTTPPLWLDRRIFPNPFTKAAHTTTATSSIQTQHHSWEQSRIGIALIDDDDDEDDNTNPTDQRSKPRSRLVVFGSQLRIQIPSPPPTVSSPPPTSHFLLNSPNSPMEFGIKTPRSNFGRSGIELLQEDHRKKIKESISMEEMEQSEDYTCVISRGPNPKTTHIFGNCIVESCCGVAKNNNNDRKGVFAINGGDDDGVFEERIRGWEKEKGVDFKVKYWNDSPVSTGDFLSFFCHHCKKRIGDGRDIYMYRGEKAFCSQECRGQGMLFDGIES